MIRQSLPLILLILAATPSASVAQVQEDRTQGRAFLSRAELEELGRRFRLYGESPVYSEQLRERARAEAAQIEARLAAGDFEVGDRVLLIVEGETALTDTFTVNRGRVLRLGEVGEVPLEGVLRAEFEPRITEFLGQYLREPRTRTESYLRLAVDGAVVRPGFVRVPANIPLADVITLAGGLQQNAKLDDIRIERGGRRIWSGYPLQEAQSGGMTVDQMRLQSGDRIVVPRRRSLTESSVRTLGLLLGLPLSIAALLTVF